MKDEKFAIPMIKEILEIIAEGKFITNMDLIAG